MNLRHLRAFVAIAETGSFQAAARRLFITQSAVSMQMKALEESLGTALFDRRRRPPTLNALGRSLLERARDLVASADAFADAATGDGQLLGTLQLGVVPSIATTILPNTLAALRTEHPQVQVRVEGGLSARLEQRVESGNLDGAVITLPERLPSRLTALPIFEELLCVAVPHSTEARSACEALRDLPFIRFNRGTGVGRIIDATLRARALVVHETMELDSIEAILMMVSRGLGVAVVPARSLTAEFTATVRTLSLPGDPVSRAVVLVIAKERQTSPLVSALHRALRRSAAGR